MIAAPSAAKATGVFKNLWAIPMVVMRQVVLLNGVEPKIDASRFSGSDSP